MKTKKVIIKTTSTALSVLGIVMMIMCFGVDDTMPISQWLGCTFGLFICSILSFWASQNIASAKKE